MENETDTKIIVLTRFVYITWFSPCWFERSKRILLSGRYFPPCFTTIGCHWTVYRQRACVVSYWQSGPTKIRTRQCTCTFSDHFNVFVFKINMQWAITNQLLAQLLHMNCRYFLRLSLRIARAETSTRFLPLFRSGHLELMTSNVRFYTSTKWRQQMQEVEIQIIDTSRKWQSA